MYLLYFILVLFFGIPAFVFVLSVFIGIPCMPTHKKQTETMMDIAGISTGKKVVDLGSGHGRLVLAAASRGAQVVGYELNPFLVLLSRILIRRAGLQGRAKIYWRSFYKADVAHADIVTCFLFIKPMLRLRDTVFKQLKPGTTIAAYVFHIPGWEPILKKEGIWVYKV